MAKIGADPEQLTKLGILFITNGGHLTTLGPQISMYVLDVDWTGPDAQRFRDTWYEYERMLRRFGDALDGIGRQLINQAQQQIVASGGQASPGLAGGGSRGAAVQQALGGPGAMGASLSPAANKGNMALMALAMKDPESFKKIMSYQSPAGALTEWTGGAPRSQAEKALDMQRQGMIENFGGGPGNSLESAARQVLGEEGLSWSDLTGAEGSREASGQFSWERGGEVSTTLQAGGATLDASVGARVGMHGEYSLGAGIADDQAYARFASGVHLGASAEAMARLENDFVPLEAQAQASAGARATAQGAATAGAEGLEARAGADAFLGADADANAKADLGGYGTAGAGAGARAGVGAHADFGGSLSMDEIRLKADFGAAFGIGADFGFDFSVNPSAVVGDVSDWGLGIADDLSGLNIGDLGSDLSDAIGEIGGTADDLVGGVVDAGSDAVDFVGDTVSKVNPFSW